MSQNQRTFMGQFVPLTTRRPRLPVISGSKLRVAQLTAAMAFDGAKVFTAGSWRHLGAYGPQVLIASSSEYVRLMERMSLQTVDVKSVDHALFVLTAVGDRPVTEMMRELLWKRFGVPVYELYVDGSSRLLASECEAQEGWHLENGAEFNIEEGEIVLRSRGAVIQTGLTGRKEDAVCPCGRSGWRIVGAEAANGQSSHQNARRRLAAVS